MKTIFLTKTLHFKLGTTLFVDKAYKAVLDDEAGVWRVHLGCGTIVAVAPKFVAQVVDLNIDI